MLIPSQFYLSDGDCFKIGLENVKPDGITKMKGFDFINFPKLGCYRVVSSVSGLSWERTAKPTQGQELSSPELSKALMSKTEFSQQEWDDFGIINLCMGSFIEAGESYFKPAARCSSARGHLASHARLCK